MIGLYFDSSFYFNSSRVYISLRLFLRLWKLYYLLFLEIIFLLSFFLRLFDWKESDFYFDAKGGTCTNDNEKLSIMKFNFIISEDIKKDHTTVSL